MSYQSLKQFVMGRPLATSSLDDERLPKRYALALFSPDALSSNAYATEEILIALAVAGTLALSLSIPIAIAIVTLLFIVILSYRQLILAYPSGGGGYVVSKENFGETASLVAGASLLIDYSLTVAVSLSAGMAAITSALPQLHSYKVDLALAGLVLITIANLRGTRESGRLFAIPTYAFVLGLGGMVVYGFVQYFSGNHPAPVAGRVVTETAAPLTMFLILRAFASGCAALTGVEAISNGVQAFKEPSAKNARQTLVGLGLILGTLFLGITFLSQIYSVVPNEHETVVSQLARGIFGTGTIYFYIQLVTMIILVIAANTSFAGFPGLASIMAADGYMPRQLRTRGLRLAFSNGILSLSVFAAVLIVGFDASVNRLIPLYAVGVFTEFTLSQFGMVRHWFRTRKNGWWRRAIINGLGGSVTFVVAIIQATTKFVDGAWIVITAVPIIVLIFRSINRHYRSIASQLTLEKLEEMEEKHKIPNTKHNVVILVASIHVGTVKALRYAKSLTPTEIRAVHINITPDQTQKVKERWDKYGMGIPLEIVESPYRDIIGPFLKRLREIEQEMSDDIVTVVIPEFVVSRWWENFLHNQTGFILKTRLLLWKDVVVISVPYHLQ
jgi:amino acid transporter